MYRVQGRDPFWEIFGHEEFALIRELYMVYGAVLLRFMFWVGFFLAEFGSDMVMEGMG